MKTILREFILLISAVVMVTGYSCCHPKSQQEEAVNKDAVSFDSIPFDSIFEIGDDDIEVRLMCSQDLWLNTEGIDTNTPLVKDMTDMYNAFTAIRSIFTDFDLVMHDADYITEARAAIEAFDLSVIQDPETRAAITDYKQKMLALFDLKSGTDNQDEADPYSYRDEANEFVTEKYFIINYCELELAELTEQINNDLWNNADVPDWEDLMSQRGDTTLEAELRDRYTKSKTLDEKVIYLIELSHVHLAAHYIDDDGYLGLMYGMLTSDEYSKYKNLLWTHWRCLCQHLLGMSKDSYIPNWIYNQVRNQCAHSTLAYIAKHPSDMMALFIMTQLALEKNIYREGSYAYGNQNMEDLYVFFHEMFEKEDDEEE